MIKEFVNIFNTYIDEIKNELSKEHPESYLTLVKLLISTIEKHADENNITTIPDSNNIHIIDDGEYRGTLLFIIPEKDYYPNTYWKIKVFYGTCSGCDTLQNIRDYSDDSPTKEQVAEYLTLVLHLVQDLAQI